MGLSLPDENEEASGDMPSINANTHHCWICGRAANERSLLIAGSRWQDRLKVLRWHAALTGYLGIRTVCSIEHAGELVTRWISVDDEVESTSRQPYAYPEHYPALQISELAVNREGLQRSLRENPRALIPLMEALIEALRTGEAAEPQFWGGRSGPSRDRARPGAAA